MSNPNNLQWFVGKKRHPFLSDATPEPNMFEAFALRKIDDNWALRRVLEEMHLTFDGKYEYIVGPFKTERGARCMVRLNPIAERITVEYAEARAELEEKMSR